MNLIGGEAEWPRNNLTLKYFYTTHRFLYACLFAPAFSEYTHIMQIVLGIKEVMLTENEEHLRAYRF